MAYHNPARTVFMVTLLCTIIMYVVLYSYQLSISSIFRLRGGERALKGSLNKSNTDSIFSDTNILREKIIVDMDKDTSLNLNISIGNIDQVNKQVKELIQGIMRSREKTHQQTGVMCDTVKCSATNTKTDDITAQNGRQKSFLTLFTTWSYNPNLSTIHNNTVNNWASFYPYVTCIVFTNDSRIKEAVLPKSWKVHPIYQFAINGLPVLKYMYKYAADMFDSDFYAYANSDILFTDNLIKTLMMLRYIFSHNTSPMMVTGQRWNVVNVNASEVNTKKRIDELVSKRGSLFQPWAADYFITRGGYPWEKVVDIVIGSLGLDNWLIIHSRKSRHVVIDATRTILAVHQSVDGDMYRSHDRDISSYNKNLIRSKYGWQSYERGKVICIENITDIEHDTIVVRKRTELAEYCRV